jgi:hypothetical protein
VELHRRACAWHPDGVDDLDWLMGQVAAITREQESGRALPWACSDAPEDYVRGLARRSSRSLRRGADRRELEADPAQAKRTGADHRGLAAETGVRAAPLPRRCASPKQRGPRAGAEGASEAERGGDSSVGAFWMTAAAG